MPYLLVKNRDGTVFEGDVDSVSTYNRKGIYDVLTDHANFISVIEKQILVRKNGAVQEIPVDNGLIKVTENKIHIYLDLK